MAKQSPFLPGSHAESLSKSVLQKFQLWRKATPIHLRRISSDLWNAAMELAAASTVNQAARFLGLDSGQLKKRVLATYGPDCPAFSRHRHGQPPISPPSASPPATRTKAMTNPLAIKKSPPPSNDGFIEATMLAAPPVLAEIRAPSGHTLRLFSPDTERLVRAFVQP